MRKCDSIHPQKPFLEIRPNRCRVPHRSHKISGRMARAISCGSALTHTRSKWAEGRRAGCVGEEGHPLILGQLEVDTQNQLHLGVIENKVAEHSRPPKPDHLLSWRRMRPGWWYHVPMQLVYWAHEPSPHWPMAYVNLAISVCKYLTLITSPRGRPDRSHHFHLSEEDTEAQRTLGFAEVYTANKKQLFSFSRWCFPPWRQTRSPFWASLVAGQAESTAPQLCSGLAHIPKWLRVVDFFNSALSLSHCDRSHASDSPVSPGCQDTCLFSKSCLPDTCQREPWLSLPPSLPLLPSLWSPSFSSFFLHNLFSRSDCNAKPHVLTD